MPVNSDQNRYDESDHHTMARAAWRLADAATAKSRDACDLIVASNNSHQEYVAGLLPASAVWSRFRCKAPENSRQRQLCVFNTGPLRHQLQESAKLASKLAS